MQIPDTEIVFGEFLFHPTIDNYGHVAFLADIEDEDDPDGIFWGFLPESGSDPDRLQLLESAVPPDDLYSPVVGPNGNTGYKRSFENVPESTLRVDGATIASTTSGFVGQDWIDPIVNGVGQVAFEDDRDTHSVWSNGFGSLTEIAKYGDTAPDAGSQTFTTFSHPVLNYHDVSGDEGGYTAFSANLNTGDTGVWEQRPGTSGVELRKVAITDDSAPGLSGVTFDTFQTGTRYGHVGINNAGRTTFKATLQGSGVTEDNNDSIWKENGSGLVLVAREGTNLPGGGAASIVTVNDTFPVINRDGDVAFHAYADGDWGIWSEGRTHSLHKVAMYGDAAPHIENTIFVDFDLNTSAIITGGPPIAINSLGQVAFFANIDDAPNTGNEIDSFNDGGVWVEDTAGQLLVLAREGEEVTIDSEDWTILEIDAWPFRSGGEDGRGTYLNDCGEVAFRVILSDDGTLFGNRKEAILVRSVRLGGDANDDGEVDIFDSNVISAHWNESVTPGTNGDVNYDGVVNIYDINVVSAGWGKEYAETCLCEEELGASAVPEPAALFLMAFGLLAACPAIRRRRT